VTGSAERPLLFLDVDGPLIPFGGFQQQYPEGFRTHEMRPEPWWVAENPLLVRLNPGHGPRLLALRCDLVWATAWATDANDLIGPLIGLPELPVVLWPESSEGEPAAGKPVAAGGAAATGAEDDDELHWKTRYLVEWAAGRPFVWVDDEITDADRVWVRAHHRGRALLHLVDHRSGLTDADFAILTDWLLVGSECPEAKLA
jgi:hypothetical protein